eukprot:3934807-Alexandrium_andersonii.AAC.1
MAVALPSDEGMQGAAAPGPPPMAGVQPAVPPEVVIPFTRFPGVQDITNPVIQAVYAAWSELAKAVGLEFISRVTGEEAERVTASPAIIPEGTWVANSIQGRRVEDVVHTFRNMDPTKGEECYAALQRILRMLNTCPKCEVPYK